MYDTEPVAYTTIYNMHTPTYIARLFRVSSSACGIIYNIIECCFKRQTRAHARTHTQTY